MFMYSALRWTIVSGTKLPLEILKGMALRGPTSSSCGEWRAEKIFGAGILAHFLPIGRRKDEPGGSQGKLIHDSRRGCARGASRMCQCCMELSLFLPAGWGKDGSGGGQESCSMTPWGVRKSFNDAPVLVAILSQICWLDTGLSKNIGVAMNILYHINLHFCI